MTFRAAVRHCLVVLIIGVASFAGLVGIDFGHHWDEPERIGTLIHARERGELLPNWYNYPSVVHDLLMATALPELVSGGPPEAAVEQPTGDREGVSAFLASHAFLLRARCVFFCVSMISVLATYAAVWRWRRDLFQAAFAAALLGFSWELGYHARWIAPDAIAASCASVCLCLLGEARSSPRRRLWLSLAAAVAGVGCGAKYPSGLLLLPCILAALREKEAGARARVVDIAILVPAFMAGYLVTTPGTLLQQRNSSPTSGSRSVTTRQATEAGTRSLRVCNTSRASSSIWVW